MMTNVLQGLPAFLLIFLRAASFFVTMPIFSYRNIPNVLKIALAFFLAWIMYFTIQPETIEINMTYVLLVIKEVLVGLCIGLMAMMLFYAVQVAGGFIDLQMGLAIANIIDPQTGAQTPLVGKFLYVVTILFLLSVNAHYLLIDGLYYSYRFIPLETLAVSFGSGSVAKLATTTFATMFVIAFQMAVPVVGTLFLVDVALGMIARTVPQVNVFIVGLPLKMLISFIVLLIAMPLFIMLVNALFEEMLTAMRGFMRLLGG